MFRMRNKENYFPIRTLIWRPAKDSPSMLADMTASVKFFKQHLPKYTIVPFLFEVLYRLLVKSAHRKINFLISQPKHMLWVLNETVLLSIQNIC